MKQEAHFVELTWKTLPLFVRLIIQEYWPAPFVLSFFAFGVYVAVAILVAIATGLPKIGIVIYSALTFFFAYFGWGSYQASKDGEKGSFLAALFSGFCCIVALILLLSDAILIFNITTTR